MKITICAAGLAAFALVSSPMGAQPGGGGRGGMMRSPAFTALDTDGDGSISAAEIGKASASLKTLDKNGDGRLTEEEVRPAFGRGGREGFGGPGGRGGRGDEPGETAPPSATDMVQTLMAFDRNGDGKLTRDEMPERMQGLFDRADADKNGVLTADEIRKSAESQAAPGARGGRGEERDEGERREGGRGEGGRRGGPGGGMNFMRMDPILAALDADGDGVISSAEIADASTSLASLDKDKDGKLSEDEVRMNMGPGRGGPGRI